MALLLEIFRGEQNFLRDGEIVHIRFRRGHVDPPIDQGLR